MHDLLLRPPIPIFLLLAALLAVLVWRRREAGRLPLVLCLGALILLWCTSSRLLSATLLETLEGGQHPLATSLQPEPDAILVLGAGFRDPDVPQPVLSDSGKERLLEGVRLARAFPGADLAFSGGKHLVAGTTCARVMGDWAERLGIEPERIVLEERAHNTRTNAVLLAAIARQKGWSRPVLVTSAYHMPRAMACFRALGLEPVPAPCDFTGPGSGGLEWILPQARALGDTGCFLHEWVGAFWYRLRGWI